MLFSILIAHYNNYHYFVDCYESIIHQTYQDFEVIIVDDCSTDGSLEKIKDLIKEDIRFKIYQNEENKGVGYTKKRCVELATGEICGFVDPDDGIVENALEIMLNHYDQETIAVYSQCYFCQDNLNNRKISTLNGKISNNNPLFFNIFFEVNHFFTFRKKAYQKTTGIDETLKIAEDQDIYLKLYEIGNFQYVKKPLYLYRRHSQGISQLKTGQKRQQQKKDWNKVLLNTIKRRGIKVLYSKPIDKIDDYTAFIFEKQNTFWKRLLRKLK